MFSKLFGKSKKSNATASSPDANTAIQQLRGAVVQLEKREVHLQKKIAECLTAAKLKSKQNNKKGALFELKKKKQMQRQCDSLQQKTLNLEFQIMALEDAMINKQTLESMQSAKSAMTATMNEHDIDAVDEVMEDLNEQMEMAQEINEAMSQPLGPVMDDEELEAELAEIEAMSTVEAVHKKVHRAQVPMQYKGQSMDKVFDRRQQVVVEEEDLDAELASLEDEMVPKTKVLMSLSQ